MRNGCMSLLMLVALVVAPFSVRAQSEADLPVARAASLEAVRRAAMVSGDVKALGDLMAADATYVHSTGLMQKRDELFSMLERGDIRYVSFTVDAVEYRVYGDTVVGTGVQHIELTSGGKALTSHSRYTVVYAPAGGELKMVAYQSTPLPEIVPKQ